MGEKAKPRQIAKGDRPWREILRRDYLAGARLGAAMQSERRAVSQYWQGGVVE